MTYSNGHPIKLVGGRLALDFVNTADWDADRGVVHEKITRTEDLTLWLDAVRLRGHVKPMPISEFAMFRRAIRQLLLGDGDPQVLNAVRFVDVPVGADPEALVSGQSLQALVAASTLSILSDLKELDRLKICPGTGCGWLFIDETKNGRRRWCIMENCGNRAKAARHYARSKAGAAGGPREATESTD